MDLPTPQQIRDMTAQVIANMETQRELIASTLAVLKQLTPTIQVLSEVSPGMTPEDVIATLASGEPTFLQALHRSWRESWNQYVTLGVLRKHMARVHGVALAAQGDNHHG